MKTILAASLLAFGLIAIGCSGAAAPGHASCHQNSDCGDAGLCHVPEGFATGLCVQGCVPDGGGCPAIEPYCVQESSNASPFSYCACSTTGADGGVSSGCGSSGFSCNVEYQLCTPQ